MPRMVGPLQTPYTDPAISTIDQAGVGAVPKGGRKIDNAVDGPGLVGSPHESNVPTPGTEETPNPLSGLSRRVDGHSLGEGDPGEFGSVPVPDLDQDNKGRTLA